MNFKNKTITVVGIAKSGFAAAKFLHDQGARVRATDSSEKKEVLENAFFLKSLGVEVETGAHTPNFILGSSLVVTSPGVPKKSTPLLLAKKHKIPVISEIELAYFFHKGCLIALTGSNGKTTTCNLIHAILRENSKPSVLCGNVGFAFLDAIREVNSKTNTVLELSSFQLEDCHHFKPNISVILNISPNHLDRHGTFQAYTKTKAMIFKNQTKRDFAVLNRDNKPVVQLSKKCPAKVIWFSKKPLKEGIFYENASVWARFGGKTKELVKTDSIKLRGEHNLENILAALAVTWVLKLDFRAVQRKLDAFETLEHRIEPVGRIRNIEFINDSKSTTIASTKAAIDAAGPPLILIAGGRDKGADFSQIETVLLEKVKLVILYGEAREKMAKSFARYKNFKIQNAFQDAVDLAFELASPGDKILLSPMCTSFDQFSSFEERGAIFKERFKELKRIHGNA